MADQKKGVRDISDLKAKLGLAKPGARPAGGAVPPPAGVVPPPGGMPAEVPPPGGAGYDIPPPAGVSRPDVIAPVGYRPPPAAPAPPAEIIDDGTALEGATIHGKKELIRNIVLGALAVPAFFVGCQCSRMVLFRGWSNKVTKDSKKIVAKLKEFNRAVRRMNALQSKHPFVDNRGRPVDTYSAEFGTEAENLIDPLKDLKEAEIFGLHYNMLATKDLGVVAQLFTYFALLQRLRHMVIALRKFEGAAEELLALKTKAGAETLQKMLGNIQFGVFFTSSGTLGVAVLEKELEVCGKKLDQKCGKGEKPGGYKIREKVYKPDSSAKQEERLFRLDRGATGKLVRYMEAAARNQEAVVKKEQMWHIYQGFRFQIAQILAEIEKLKPGNILKVYNTYATRPMANKYIIF